MDIFEHIERAADREAAIYEKAYQDGAISLEELNESLAEIQREAREAYQEAWAEHNVRC